MLNVNLGCVTRLCVKADLVYSGKPGLIYRNVYIVWENDKIVEITQERPKNVNEVFEFDRAVVTPAFIDAHCHIGLIRAGENPEEEEVNEKMDTVLPHLDALASIYMDDPSFRESVEFGVLYSCVLPGSGNVIGGRAVLIRNFARDVEEAFIKYCGIKVALGYNPRSVTKWRGTRPSTRMGSFGILYKTLQRAQDALKLVEKGKRDIEEIDVELRALFPVVRGEEPLRVHLHKKDDLLLLLKLAREFNIKLTVEHACDIYEKYVFERIKSENIPLIYGPLDSFAYKTELKHENWRNVKYLVEVDLDLIALMSDHPVVLQRNLYLQLRFFRRFGMSPDKCIALVTYNPARILGVDNTLGTVEPGKTASIVVWNGDPFNLDSYPVLVIAEGRKVYEEH